MEIISKLGINVGLLIAQIVNFLIVMGVLTYLVYKPLLRLIDARRDRVRKSMEDAERIEEQMQKIEEEKTRALTKIDKEAGDILNDARKRGEAARQELITAAQREADELLAKARKQIEEERNKVFDEVEKSITTMIIRMTQKILEREFTSDDQKRLVAALEKELPKSLR
jgi:F-type H+-transporting ATPase subunit b